MCLHQQLRCVAALGAAAGDSSSLGLVATTCHAPGLHVAHQALQPGPNLACSSAHLAPNVVHADNQTWLPLGINHAGQQGTEPFIDAAAAAPAQTFCCPAAGLVMTVQQVPGPQQQQWQLVPLQLQPGTYTAAVPAQQHQQPLILVGYDGLMPCYTATPQCSFQILPQQEHELVQCQLHPMQQLQSRQQQQQQTLPQASTASSPQQLLWPERQEQQHIVVMAGPASLVVQQLEGSVAVQYNISEAAGAATVSQSLDLASLGLEGFFTGLPLLSVSSVGWPGEQQQAMGTTAAAAATTGQYPGVAELCTGICAVKVLSYLPPPKPEQTFLECGDFVPATPLAASHMLGAVAGDDAVKSGSSPNSTTCCFGGSTLLIGGEEVLLRPASSP